MMKQEDSQYVIRKMVRNIENVIVGKTEAIYLSMVALLSNGHFLLEDVPGVGKTMLIRSIATTVGGLYKRIQFTPDLLPSDVIGVSIYNQKIQEFEYRPGPIMANVVLADEINRTSPKTQSALLEAMEEGKITVDGNTYPIPQPFFVMATQNPIEYEGTFPLPEAQLDRFMLRIKMGYPDAENEMRILDKMINHHPIEDLQEVVSLEELVELQNIAREVYVEESLKRYIVTLVETTRNHEQIYLGVSTRGAIALVKAAQSLALIRGRSFVVPDDIKYLVPAVFEHRIILKADARLRGYSVEQLLQDILKKTGVPTSSEKAKRDR